MSPNQTLNAFLNGRVQLWQPKNGYRAGVDPVLLAASVPAQQGDHVLELGCGAGAAFLCLCARVAGVRCDAVEVQSEYAALARKNVSENGANVTVWEADLAALPEPLIQKQYHHVFANPPYFDRTASTQAHDAGREVAMGEATPLSTWVSVASKRVRPRGTVTFIHRAEKLPELLEAMRPALGSLQVLPLQPREGREAGLVLVRGQKGGRGNFRLHAPILMHQGVRHTGDGESYTPQIRAVLRDGDALPFSNV